MQRREEERRFIHSAGRWGWEAFLSHGGTRCAASCSTCRYWEAVWPDRAEREAGLLENLERVRSFRNSFPELERIFPSLVKTLPDLLTKLYSDCQAFAEAEISTLLERLEAKQKE